MDNPFFDHPVINSPYEEPDQHWELDKDGQPTQQKKPLRRPAEFITPIPKPRKRKAGKGQQEMVFDEGKGLSTRQQQYDPTSTMINEIRKQVKQWRNWPNPSEWQVTPETVRLLQHWRHHQFSSYRPFFCQVEAIETAIWLTEVAPRSGKAGTKYLTLLGDASDQANPGLLRLALKLATGAGKTTVMAMLIAWQTVNAVRRPGSKRFTRGFLVVAPGITIRDRLRVLQPNDPDSYYQSRELVPSDMLPDLQRAKIVITNYHAFKLRERTDVSKGTRAALEGWREERLETTETEGQMLQRVMPELMGLKNILVLNDEAHHCYREKPETEDEEGDLKGDDRKEAEKNREAARLWISGIEAATRKLGVCRVSAFREWDACEMRLAVNEKRLGLNRNTHEAVFRAFKLRADVTVHLEDDTVPSPVAFRYFEWAVRELLLPDVKSPDGCQILLASGYNKPRTELPSHRSHDCSTRPIWSPWGWAVNRARLTWLIVNWCFRKRKCFTCQFRSQYRRTRREIFPVLSRIQNIGYEKGQTAARPSGIG
jgi:hypothetical protein